jgi:hypothetical protein
MKIRLNQNLSTPKGKLTKDEVIEIETSEDGLPLDRFWRDRLKDSEIDNCIEIVKTPSKSKEK